MISSPCSNDAGVGKCGITGCRDRNLNRPDGTVLYSRKHKPDEGPLVSGQLLDIFVDPGKKTEAGLLGKYLPNSSVAHAVILHTQQDSAQIRLWHHRN